MPRFLIIAGDGINCERETKVACEAAGAEAQIMHINDLLQDKAALVAADAIVLPGGFSFGDQLGSGKILALKMKHGLGNELQQILRKKTPILGICNGFQVLLHLGLLPDPVETEKRISLVHNAGGKFIDRWVDLEVHASKCIWTGGKAGTMRLPIRHGEGNLQGSGESFAALRVGGQIVMTYGGSDAGVNGSTGSIAGICDPSGVILGMMPHPEGAVSAFVTGGQVDGLGLFGNAVDFLSRGL